MKSKLNSITISVITFLLGLPYIVLSAPINNDLVANVANGAGISILSPDTSIPTTVGAIISIILSFVGTIFFILIIISGIQWMTAGGNEEAVTKSKTRIVQAIIGLAITVGAYFITYFISNTLGAIT